MKLSSRLLLVLSAAPFLAAQTQFSTDLLALNPVGYWPLHGNANDASNRGSNGTIVNGLTFTGIVNPLGVAANPAAVFASAYRQFVSVPANGSFDFDAHQPGSVLAWIRTSNQGVEAMVIAGKFNPVNNTGWVFAVDNGDVAAPRGSGRLLLFCAAAGKEVLVVESTSSVNDGGWHFVVATYDGSGTASGVHLYIDGVAAATTTGVDALGSNSLVNTSPFTIGGLTDPSAPFEGNINEVAILPIALTPAQVLQLAEDAESFKRILGQFAFGGGWYSAIYFTNAGTTPVSFPVSFIADNGTPLIVPSIGAASRTITLAAGASTVIEAPDTGSLTQGYVSLSQPPGVNAYGVFRQSVAGAPDQEAVVQLTGAGAKGAEFVYDDSKFVTGVAIVNPSSVATTVTITVTDLDGNVIGTSSLPLDAKSKTAVALRSLPGLNGMAGKQGTARFTVPVQTTATPTGNISVLGLRFNGTAFTSIPAFGRPGN